MIIKYNGIDVSDRLISYKKSSSFVDNRIIGNVSSFQLEISLNNTDHYFDDLNTSLYWSVKEYDSSIEEYFIVYESPEKYTKTLSLKLYDNVYCLDIAYVSSLAYPTTIQSQLDDIASLTGFSFNVDDIPSWLLNKEVVWYDNTITIRTYLGWIAEISGTNVFAVGKDGFVFKLLSNYPDLTTDKLSSYEKSELYQLTKVCYDDSLNVFEKGEETGNTLYLDSGNLYVDSQEIIDYIYGLYNGLSMNIVTGVNMVLPVNIQLGNMVNYNDEFTFMLTEINSEYKGGDYLLANVEGSIYTKNEEKQVQKISNDTKIRKIQVTMDQESQRLDIVAQDVEDTQKQTAQLTVGIDEISTTLNSVNESIYKFETGTHNIFSNCNQQIEGITASNNMPLDIDMNYMRGRDICISVYIDFLNVIVGSGYAGATFDVGYADGTKKTYSCYLDASDLILQHTLSGGTTTVDKRFWTTYKIEDKEITSVSNLKIVITCKGEKVIVGRPKVEFGTYPTGFEFDLEFIRDNITTIDKQYSEITQAIEGINLSIGDITEKVETIDGQLTDVNNGIVYLKEDYSELKLAIDSIELRVVDNEETITKNYSSLSDEISNNYASVTKTIDTKYSELKLYTDEIVATVSKNLETTTTKLDGNISSVKEELTASIKANADSITSEVKNTYATKTELKTTEKTLSASITTTAESITNSVKNTYATKDSLSAYVTTTTLESKITQTVESINSTVSKKVGSDEIISKINQSAESITIDANKISLAGKSINLTSDNIVINSTNFSVDKNGNIAANSATLTKTTINGGSLITTSTNGMKIEIAGYSIYGRNDSGGVMYGLYGTLSSETGQMQGAMILYDTSNITRQAGISPDFFYINGTDGKSSYMTSNAIRTSGSVTASAYNTSSDQNLKKYIKNIPEVFYEAWKELTPRTYKYKADHYKDGVWHVGFVAQEVIEVFEKYGLNYEDYGFVSSQTLHDDETEYFCLSYIEFGVLNTFVSQKHEEKINDLESRLKALENKEE